MCTRRNISGDSIRIKGIDIPSGLPIAVNVLDLHYNEEYWGPVDTKKFYPLRHSKEFPRNPACYFAFGYGPRSKDNFILIKANLIVI